MTSRMDKVAEDVALAALRKATAARAPLLRPETLEEAFRAGWPIPNSTTPMNDAINAATQAANNCTSQDTQNWESTVGQAWRPAVEETVEEYFKAARRSFQMGEARQGAEALTDAVRATLGHIAASRNWPHSTEEDLYSTAAALGSGTGWPRTMEEFDRALGSLSDEGGHLNSALGASMGLPRSIDFGTYLDAPDCAGENGLSFAGTVIELANQLAGQEPARA